jgi:Domain of unknown function (DUF4399)
MARLFFVTPAHGATVTSPVSVQFGIEGELTVGRAGYMMPNTGVFGLIIDSLPVPRGDRFPHSDRKFTYDGGETQTEVKLSPGKHTLTLQFVDGAYRSYGPEASETIHVNVS